MSVVPFSASAGHVIGEAVASLPLQMLDSARQMYVQMLFRTLVRAAGAPAQLVFVHGLTPHGFRVDLVAGLDPVMCSRVGVALDKPIKPVTVEKESVWPQARAQGISREQFDTDYDRALNAQEGVPVTGWDVVRYLALGGGAKVGPPTEGYLTIEVAERGMHCYAGTPQSLCFHDSQADADTPAPACH